MPTYLGWTVVPMPSSPSAPQSCEFSIYDPVALTQSPFTGQQQIQQWGATWMEASVSLPPLTLVQASAWVTWLQNVQGQACVFKLFDSGAFAATYAPFISGMYWRMKSNTRKYSITAARVYGLQFELRQAL